MTENNLLTIYAGDVGQQQFLKKPLRGKINVQQPAE
jgi:hypothetical protein